jgi:pimeloyl-ACP methyl ester carboxylesterase
MMKKLLSTVASVLIILAYLPAFAQSDKDEIVLHNTTWDPAAPAGFAELVIPSGGSKLQGFMYKPNGKQKHPTLILLHGYPGNEKNLDLAQVVRAHGWNVVYFDYAGSWGSEGAFSFKHCVQDVVSTVAYLKANANKLNVDTANMVLFGHSMGGWICLKALQQLPGIKKGFALSTWDIYGEFKNVKSKDDINAKVKADGSGPSFVLNKSAVEIFSPVLDQPSYYDLANDVKALADKQIIMLDEHTRNKPIADAIKAVNTKYFDYEVWQTDHPFTNKRVSLMKKLLAVLDK